MSLLIPAQSAFGLLTETAARLPAILILIPPVLQLRGNLFGVLCGRLSTALHLGTIEPRFRGNSSAFKSTLLGIFLLATLSSIWSGLLGYVMGTLFDVASPSPIWYLSLFFYLAIAFLSAMLATAVTVPITLAAAFQAYKRGLDPDVLLYPMMSSVSDSLTGFSIVVVARFMNLILVV
ncbi:MAG: magnesium transporter [Candidatus Bathyarchaeia archaeon]